MILAAVLLVVLVAVCGVLLARRISAPRPGGGVSVSQSGASAPVVGPSQPEPVVSSASSPVSNAAASVTPGLYRSENSGAYTVGFEPSLRIDAGDTFVFNVNLGSGMNVVTGRYRLEQGRVLLEDLVITFGVEQTPGQLVFEIVDGDTLRYAEGNPVLGITEPGGLYRWEPAGQGGAHETESPTTFLTRSASADPIQRVKDGFFTGWPMMRAEELLANGGFTTWATRPGVFGNDTDVVVSSGDAAFVFEGDSLSGGYTFSRLTVGDSELTGEYLGAVLRDWFDQCYAGVPGTVADLPAAAFAGGVDAQAEGDPATRVQGGRLVNWPGATVSALCGAGGYNQWSQRAVEGEASVTEVTASDGNGWLSFRLNTETGACELWGYGRMGSGATGRFAGFAAPEEMDRLYALADLQ